MTFSEHKYAMTVFDGHREVAVARYIPGAARCWMLKLRAGSWVTSKGNRYPHIQTVPSKAECRRIMRGLCADPMRNP